MCKPAPDLIRLRGMMSDLRSPRRVFPSRAAVRGESSGGTTCRGSACRPHPCPRCTMVKAGKVKSTCRLESSEGPKPKTATYTCTCGTSFDGLKAWRQHMCERSALRKREPRIPIPSDPRARARRRAFGRPLLLPQLTPPTPLCFANHISPRTHHFARRREEGQAWRPRLTK